MSESLENFFTKARNGELKKGYSINYKSYTLVYDEEENHRLVELWKDNLITRSAVDKLDKSDFDEWEDEINSMIEYGCEDKSDWKKWAKQRESG